MPYPARPEGLEDVRGDRLAVAAGCRDRAAATADGPAAAELARADPLDLREELDAAFSLFRNQPRPWRPSASSSSRS